MNKHKKCEHKLDDMVDIINKTCIYEDCKKRPNFNKKGELKALYCNSHKLDGMVDVLSKTCIFEGCKKRPNFNKEGELKALYCSEHKLDGMVDVIHKTCIFKDCKKRPNFNKEGEKRGIYCSEHKLNGMVDIINKTCKTYLCYIQTYNKKYNGYCLNCCINICPEITVSRNYKTKENEVVSSIKESFPNFTWVADKTIKEGCSKRRPDLLLDMGSHIIIVEIDENKHQGYSCENKRIMELSQDLNFRPIIFIRFNPDAYIKDGKTISSCWSQNGNGILVIKKSKQKEWEERIIILKQEIKLNLNYSSDKTIKIIELFY